ncbi:hypothetical protein EIP86_009002 [Pleurotus ostreatoroseus]|nr:hypothetical protein EIP86_009002 [Pleurotus ostreatoroseus]
MSRNPPFISRRISLRFLPALPSEHTTTIVLNGGGRTRLYTDFRPLIADPSACEWAFAGAKEDLEDGRCRWTRVVDSHWANGHDGDGEEEADIGRCEPLPNGDELETGEMRNPDTGRVEPYEEVWREEKVERGSRVVVLQLYDAERRARGVCIRVGAWAQGVAASQGALVYARRWKFEKIGGLSQGEWVLDAAYGDGAKTMPEPRGKTLEDSHMEIPREEGSALVWEIEEDYTWDGEE